MDIFPLAVKPDWGFNESPTTNVTESRLGDGYVFREPNGINFRRTTWQPGWSSLEKAEGESTYDWLKARQRLIPFLWQHPLTGVMYQVVCQEVAKTYDTWNNVVLTTTFEQDFNPQE